jgi:hypothetical protein
MEEKKICALLGFDEKTNQYFDQLKFCLDNQGFHGLETKGLPHHITMGWANQDKEKEFIDLIQKIALETKQFEVKFSHVGIFSQAKVLFVGIDIHPEILKIKNEIGTYEYFAPHATMLIEKKEIIYQAIPHLMDQFQQFIGTIDSIFIYEFFPARLIAKVDLKK